MKPSNINSLVYYVIENSLNFARNSIKPGIEVLIVLKEHQRTEKLTYGKVKDILTSKSYHTRGIKVRLEDGNVGRVQKILVTPLKEITFPKEEHKDIINRLLNNKYLFTTRVDKEYNKYKVNDILLAPEIGYYFSVYSVNKINNIKNHPYYNFLTPNQINLLSKYNKIDVIKLVKLGIK